MLRCVSTIVGDCPVEATVLQECGVYPCPRVYHRQFRRTSRTCRSLCQLVERGINATVYQIRQLAAVELRKRIDYDSGKLWMSVPQTEREQLKANFPELILKEQRYVLPSFRVSLFLSESLAVAPLSDTPLRAS